jgi:uncharacterized tellurite resistance protein B-like protein
MSTFTVSHALVIMFFEMGNADGSLEREELHKIGELSKKYIDAQGADFNQVISESLDWYLDQTNVEQRITSIFEFASNLKDLFEKSILVLIANDLVKIANADDEIHDQEGAFFRACLECMGLKREDLG